MSAGLVIERQALPMARLSVTRRSAQTKVHQTAAQGAKRNERLATMPTPASTAMDEPSLIAAARLDPTAFGPLYERYVDQIYRYVYRRTGNHMDAEDLTAQTFQKALIALPSYEWRGAPFGAWLYRIAANLIFEWRRKRFREVTTDVVLDDLIDPDFGSDDPAVIVDRTLANDDLLQALKRLPLHQQQVLVLRFARGLTNREIAERFGRSESSVKGLVHRSMRALRQVLEGDEMVLRSSGGDRSGGRQGASKEPIPVSAARHRSSPAGDTIAALK